MSERSTTELHLALVYVWWWGGGGGGVGVGVAGGGGGDGGMGKLYFEQIVHKTSLARDVKPRVTFCRQIRIKIQ